MRIIDARTGHVVRPGQMVKNGPRADDWYTILRISFRSLLTRTAHVIRHDGHRDEVACPVTFLPPGGGLVAIIYPS